MLLEKTRLLADHLDYEKVDSHSLTEPAVIFDYIA